MNRTWRRRLTLLAVASACVVLVAALLVRHFGAAIARREVEFQLRQLGAGSVELGSLSIGWQQLVVRDIRLYDNASDDPWMRADRMVARINLWDAIRGDRRPTRIVVERGRARLRMAADGELLSGLPEAVQPGRLPSDAIQFRDAAVTLERAGSDPWQATAIDGQLLARSAGVSASATIGDAWGATWEARLAQDGVTEIRLSTERLRISGRELADLPGLPAGFVNLEEVSAAVTIRAEFGPEADAASAPLVEVSVDDLAASLPSRTWAIDDGRGQLVVENQILHLNGLRAKSGGGELAVSGEFDLSARTGRLDGVVERLRLREVPRAWGIPPQLAGLVSGTVAATVEFRDDRLFLAGTSQGTIDEVQVDELDIDPIDFEVRLDRQPVGDRPTGTVSLGLGVTELDVQQLLVKLDANAAHLAAVPRGKMSGTLRMTAPLQSLHDPQQYQGRGAIRAPQLALGRLAARDVQAQVLIDGGQVTLDDAHLNVAGGHVAGRVLVGLDAGTLTADLSVAGLAADRLAALAAGNSLEISGLVDGTLAVRGDWRELANVDGWEASGTASSARLAINDEAVTGIAAGVELRRGVLRLHDLRAARDGVNVTATATLDLHSPQPFSADVAVGEFDVGDVIQELPAAWSLPAVQGRASLAGNLTGTLQPFRWQAKGEAAFSALAVDRLHAAGGRLRWQLDARSLQVTDLTAQVEGGSVVVTVSFPFDTGTANVTGRFTGLASERLWKPPDERLMLAGPISGRFAAELPPGGLERLELHAEFNGPRLAADTIEVTGLNGTVDYRAGDVRLALNGQALEGRLFFDGTGRLAAVGGERQLEGRIRAEGIELAAWSVLAENRRLQPLRGAMNANLNFSIAGPHWEPEGKGTISVNRLGWNDIPLAPLARATIELSPRAIVISDVTARLAEGHARGEITLPLDSAQGGTFRATLERVGAQRLLAIWPELEGVSDGNLDVHVEGRMDRRWYGSARLKMPRGVVAGIPLQRLSAPFNWTFAPDSERVQVRARDASVHVGGGRVSADLEITWGHSLAVKCNGRLRSVKLHTLLKHVPRARKTIDGDLTADFTIAGRGVRSVKDLTGTYNAKLVQSRSMQLPILQDLTSSLGVGNLNGRFETTESRGRLTKGGIVHVDQMFLANSDLQMEVNGRLWLGGRIDLDVTAHTGEFEATTALGQLIRTPLRFIQPVGIGLLIRANDFLERRLLFFKVGGTIRNPIVRPRAGEFLSQELVLFFLDEASAQLLR